MERKCEIECGDNDVVLGLITFLEKKPDGEHKAIIHRIDTILDFESPERAEEFGCGAIDAGHHDCYLVPSLYKGDIVLDRSLM